MGLFRRADEGMDPSVPISPTFTYGGMPPRADGLPAQCTAQLNPRPNIVGSASSVDVPGDGVGGFVARAMQQSRRRSRYREMLSGSTTARGTMGARPTSGSAASQIRVGQDSRPAAPQKESIWGSALRELREEFQGLADFTGVTSSGGSGSRGPQPGGFTVGAASQRPQPSRPVGSNGGISGGMGSGSVWDTPPAGQRGGAPARSAPPPETGGSFRDIVNAARQAAAAAQEYQDQLDNRPGGRGGSGGFGGGGFWGM